MKDGPASVVELEICLGLQNSSEGFRSRLRLSFRLMDFGTFHYTPSFTYTVLGLVLV